MLPKNGLDLANKVVVPLTSLLIAEPVGSLDAENVCGLDGQVSWRRK